MQQWARDSGTCGGRGTRPVAWLGADRARGRSEAPEANDGGARRAALDAKEVEQRKGRSGRGWRAAWSLTARTRSMAPTAPGTTKTGGSSRPAPAPGKRPRERSSGRRSLGAGRRPGGVGAPAGIHGGGGLLLVGWLDSGDEEAEGNGTRARRWSLSLSLAAHRGKRGSSRALLARCLRVWVAAEGNERG